MTLVKETKYVKEYKGSRGEAVIARNFGNNDKTDKYTVHVVVDGEFKRLATRASFANAVSMAEAAIQ